MNIDQAGIDFISSNEGGIRNEAYRDGANIPTIGIGGIWMPNGLRVQIGDTITNKDAMSLFLKTVEGFVAFINQEVKTQLTQSQFNALTDFCYNVGSYNFQTSTLLRKVNVNPNDSSICEEFMRWIYDIKKQIEPGLEVRRQRECEYYTGKPMRSL